MSQNTRTSITTLALLALSGLIGTPIAAQNAPAQAPAVEFMSDYIPTDCTIQFGYATADTTETAQSFTQDFERTMDAAIDDYPEASCDAIVGTDSGESRNFNFIQAEQGVYKVVTKSRDRYDTETNTYMFDVLGVRFIPIDNAGELDASRAKTMFAIAGSTCLMDELEEPYSAFCEFAATDTETGDIAIGQLNYLY